MRKTKKTNRQDVPGTTVPTLDYTLNTPKNDTNSITSQQTGFTSANRNLNLHNQSRRTRQRLIRHLEADQPDRHFSAEPTENKELLPIHKSN